MRAMLEQILRTQAGLEAFAYAESADAALQAASDLEPKLILVDFDLPDVNGLEVSRRILSRSPDATIILLIEAPEEAYRAAAAARGVANCIAKARIWNDLPAVVAKLLG